MSYLNDKYNLSLAPKKHDLVEYLRRYGNPGLVPGT
jgi:hypothetical protein